MLGRILGFVFPPFQSLEAASREPLREERRSPSSPYLGKVPVLIRPRCLPAAVEGEQRAGTALAAFGTPVLALRCPQNPPRLTRTSA